MSATFHHMFVHYTFSLVWVVEWPPFGKELPIRLHVAVCSYILSACYFSYFPFGFESGVWFLISVGPVHCLIRLIGSHFTV